MGFLKLTEMVDYVILFTCGRLASIKEIWGELKCPNHVFSMPMANSEMSWILPHTTSILTCPWVARATNSFSWPLGFLKVQMNEFSSFMLHSTGLHCPLTSSPPLAKCLNHALWMPMENSKMLQILSGTMMLITTYPWIQPFRQAMPNLRINQVYIQLNMYNHCSLPHLLCKVLTMGPTIEMCRSSPHSQLPTNLMMMGTWRRNMHWHTQPPLKLRSRQRKWKLMSQLMTMTVAAMKILSAIARHQRAMMRIKL